MKGNPIAIASRGLTFKAIPRDSPEINAEKGEEVFVVLMKYNTKSRIKNMVEAWFMYSEDMKIKKGEAVKRRRLKFAVFKS